MATTTIDPLNWQAPIVNQDGTPTPYFIRQWDRQNRGNASGITVVAGSGLAGGGAAPLGGSVTLSLGPLAAGAVTYDNTASGLTAVNVQAAIDELAGGATGLTHRQVMARILSVSDV